MYAIWHGDKDGPSILRNRGIIHVAVQCVVVNRILKIRTLERAHFPQPVLELVLIDDTAIGQDRIGVAGIRRDEAESGALVKVMGTTSNQTACCRIKVAAA